MWGIHGVGLTYPEADRFTPTCVGNTRQTGRSSQPRTVHPHVCGEYVVIAEGQIEIIGSPPRVWGIRHLTFQNIVLNGSPPRVWGIREIHEAHPKDGRFTPTCVENTCRHSCRWRCWPVHPHVCGEYADPGLRYRFAFRFTPTCVGNTSSPSPVCAHCAVHPHVCGEYDFLRAHHGRTLGSPPRVWGILQIDNQNGLGGRFTPTCVGNTFSRLSPLTIYLGSPPRVWGILRFAKYFVCNRRFTPTCVGNTTLRVAAAVAASVHPHVCGEYYPVDGRIYRSPRFTPTCVGNTRSSRAVYHTRPVHPHVCGEYFW